MHLTTRVGLWREHKTHALLLTVTVMHSKVCISEMLMLVI